MTKKKYPKTNAMRTLIERDIPFQVFTYAYEDKGGTRISARELGVDEHAIVKTLVMEANAKDPLIVLMHGDREVSTKQLARAIGVKSITPCEPKAADHYSGYQVGGTSPVGTRRTMPVYAEASIFDLEEIYINAGRRGLLVRIDPNDLHKVLEVIRVQVAI